MAIGLNISGVGFGSFTQLGRASVLTSTQVPSQHAAYSVVQSQPTPGNRTYDCKRLMEVRQQIMRQDRPFTGPKVCGMPGAPPCMSGDVTGAFSGLGVEGDEECGSFCKAWNWFKAGPPGWRTTPEERDQYEKTVRELPGDVQEKVGTTATILNTVTKPWFLAAVGGVIVLSVLAPYVAPFLRRR